MRPCATARPPPGSASPGPGGTCGAARPECGTRTPIHLALTSDGGRRRSGAPALRKYFTSWRALRSLRFRSRRTPALLWGLHSLSPGPTPTKNRLLFFPVAYGGTAFQHFVWGGGSQRSASMSASIWGFSYLTAVKLAVLIGSGQISL